MYDGDDDRQPSISGHVSLSVKYTKDASLLAILGIMMSFVKSETISDLTGADTPYAKFPILYNYIGNILLCR